MYSKSLNSTFKFLLLLVTICSVAVAFSGPIPATFVKVKSTKISNGLFKALKDKRPDLMKELKPQGGEIFGGSLSIYKNNDAILILQGQAKGPKLTLDKKIIDKIPNVLGPIMIIVRCECELGPGACIYAWHPDGYLESCKSKNGNCQDCDGSLEIYVEDGPVTQIPF